MPPLPRSRWRIVGPPESRRILLSRQGLSAPPGRRSGPATVRNLIRRLGFVQVDSINVLERAHHLTLHARLEGYRPETLTRLLETDRSLFEHWTHDASVIPIEFHQHWRPRFRRYAERASHREWWRDRLGEDPEPLLSRVESRIRSEGPLRGRDFEEEKHEDGGGPWWNWHPGKAALEHLWRTGRLAIAGRHGFEKIYDLVERVHPDVAHHSEPDTNAHLAWACREAIDRLGVATASEIAAFWKSISIADARVWCRAAVDRDELEPVLIEDLEGARREGYATSDSRADARSEPWSDGFRLLCPFDPVIRDRRRLASRFGFDYRFEAFTPAAKRRYGYYVLPILHGECFVGRIDPRFDRRAELIEVRGPWWEDGRGGPTDQRRLKAALDRLAERLGATEGWRWISAGST